jgi:outer membrane receptor protein involved in Fe transport
VCRSGGGADQVGYFLSSELGRREGSLPNNEVRRRAVRGNLDIQPSDRVTVSVSSGFTSSETQLPVNDNTLTGYVGLGVTSMPWELPIRRADLISGDESLTCPIAYEIHRAMVGGGVDFVSLEDLGLSCGPSPFLGGTTFDDIATLENEQRVERFTGSSTVRYRPFSFMAATGTVGYDQFSDQTSQFVPVDPGLPFGDRSHGLRSMESIVHRNLTVEGNLSTAFDLTPAVRSTTTVGGQFFRNHVTSTGSIGRMLPAGTRTVSNAVRTEGFESRVETRTLGGFVEQQVAVGDRFFLTPAVRFDRNSAFGENLGTKAYPRVMASYVVSEEGWFPDRMFDSFRLRGAWGQSGRQPASFAALQLLEARRVTFRDRDLAGVSLTGPGNPELRPETASGLEVGFEADVLDGYLNLDLTWFRQSTEDAIVSRQMAPSSGFSSPMFANVGEMKSRGWEVGLGVLAVNAPSLRWDWRLNLATNRGRITRLDEPILFGIDGSAQRHQEGYPFAAYFSRDYFINEAGEVEATEEAVYMGHPTPEVEGALSTSLRLLDRLTLSATLGFAGGHQQFNSTQEFRCGFLGGGRYGGLCPEIFETDPDGQRSEAARIKAAAASDVQFGPWMEDADFLRLRSVSARFEMPERWMGWLGASRGSFTVTGENLALFTRYTGLDPEVNFAGGAQAARSDFLTLPHGKRVHGQLSVTF